MWPNMLGTWALARFGVPAGVIAITYKAVEDIDNTENPVDRLRIPPATITEGSIVNAIAWSRDGGNITSLGDDAYIRQWDVLTQKASWSTSLSSHCVTPDA